VYNVLLIEAYFRLGDAEKAKMIADTLKKNVYQEMNYFISLGRDYYSYLLYEKRVAFYTLDELRRLAETYNQPELKTEMEQKLQEYSAALGVGM
jgi:hypothetical protein